MPGLIVAQESIGPYDSMQMLRPDVTIAPEFETHGLSLDELQSMALGNNPTLRQSQAQVEAERGAALQASLGPNPYVGYVAEQIGVNGTAGELHGATVQQEIVRGNKLGLSREKYAQRARIAETNYTAQRQRVLNDVAIRYHQTAAAQRLIGIHQRTIDTSQDNVLTYKEMLNLGQVGAAEVLKAEVESRRETVNLKQALNEQDRAWRELASFIGVPTLPSAVLIDESEQMQAPMEWDIALSQLLATSPQIIAARQKVRHDRIVIQREIAEPTPNLLLGLTTGYNAETKQAVAGMSAGMFLPVFNRNQGTIRQARADLANDCAELERLELALRNSLATQYNEYLTAWQRVQEFDETMLPKSREAVEMLEKSYQDRRAPWISVLDAKRLLLSLEAEQVDNRLTYNMADISIRGNLLMGGLNTPDGPLNAGHIDANNQPR
ncbi:MAG: TolC family protein [Aureliella sp.]